MCKGSQALIITWPGAILQQSMMEASLCYGDVYMQQELEDLLVKLEKIYVAI